MHTAICFIWLVTKFPGSMQLRDTLIDSRTCSQVVSGIGRKQRSAAEQHGEEEEEEAADSTFSFGDSLQYCGGVFL